MTAKKKYDADLNTYNVKKAQYENDYIAYQKKLAEYEIAKNNITDAETSIRQI